MSARVAKSRRGANAIDLRPTANFRTSGLWSGNEPVTLKDLNDAVGPRFTLQTQLMGRDDRRKLRVAKIFFVRARRPRVLQRFETREGRCQVNPA